METNPIVDQGQCVEDVWSAEDYTNPALQKRRGGTVMDEIPWGDEGEDESDGDEDDEHVAKDILEGQIGKEMREPRAKDGEGAGSSEEPRRSSVEQQPVGSSDPTPSKSFEAPPLLPGGLKQATTKCTCTRTPLERFRAIANNIKHNLKWAKMLSLSTKQDSEQKSQFTVEHEDGHDTSLTFNVNAFKANVQTMNTLPPAVKLTMSKNPWERTAKDLAYIYSFVDKLKCFARYSSLAKHELSSVLQYESFEEGRVIVKQGHPGLSFYFILSGVVTVEVTEMDSRTGERNTHVIAENTAGSSFGELSLLHGTTRTATIICKVDTEFLRLDKPDFDQVLRRSYEQEWETRMSALRSLSAFGQWSEDELSATNDRAKLVEFQPNTLIVGNLTQPPDDIYFVKSGICKVVRQVTLLQSRLPFGQTRLSLPPLDAEYNVPSTFHLEKYQKLVCKLLHVANTRKGDFFGVGEDLRRTHIISTGKVECILVSRVSFMRHDRGKSLEPMRHVVEQLYPTYEESFSKYLLDKRWRAYKQGLVKELVRKRNIPNNTTLEDVPQILRQDVQIA